MFDRDLNVVIGWLVRENKIDFECFNGDDCLFLSVNVYIGWIWEIDNYVGLKFL